MSGSPVQLTNHESISIQGRLIVHEIKPPRNLLQVGPQRVTQMKKPSPFMNGTPGLMKIDCVFLLLCISCAP